MDIFSKIEFGVFLLVKSKKQALYSIEENKFKNVIFLYMLMLTQE
jgi:hypothetical protein